MAFDPVRRVVIVFGGLLDDLSYLNDTWEWNTVTKTWTNVTPGASPLARQGARLVHDATNGRLVLFGGVDANTFYADTWVWNLSARTWTPLATTASSAAGRPFVGRTFPGATFNPTAGHGVTVFGGIGYPTGSSTVTDFNDIWELRGTVWTDVTPAGGNPPGRGWTQLVWDPLFNRIVMFAGYRVAAPAQSYGDTWSFVNGGWSEIVPQAAGARRPRQPRHGLRHRAKQDRRLRRVSPGRPRAGRRDVDAGAVDGLAGVAGPARDGLRQTTVTSCSSTAAAAPKRGSTRFRRTRGSGTTSGGQAVAPARRWSTSARDGRCSCSAVAPASTDSSAARTRTRGSGTPRRGRGPTSHRPSRRPPATTMRWSTTRRTTG